MKVRLEFETTDLVCLSL